MQFSAVTFVLAAMATVAAATETVTVYACSSTAVSTYGYASSTIASTGLPIVPTPTGSPIPYATGAASLNGVSALGMVVAGGVALLL